jgi:hypothetical protein
VSIESKIFFWSLQDFSILCFISNEYKVKQFLIGVMEAFSVFKTTRGMSQLGGSAKCSYHVECKEREMDRACSAHVRELECIYWRRKRGDQ